MARRRIFVGDIQGCRDELARLLDRVAFDPAGDELHPVGDLVNRGPDSAGVLRLLIEAGAGGVLGNHDLHLLRVAAGERPLGPRDTFHDVLEAADREPLLRWLSARPVVRQWEDLTLIHAGLHPDWSVPGTPLELADRFPGATHPHALQAEVSFALTVRYCAPDGTRPDADWPPPPAPFRPWFDHYPAHPDERRTVVFGHWARMGLVVRDQLRGLDTGCVWGQRLTAWIAEEDHLVHVDAARAYSAHRD